MKTKPERNMEVEDIADRAMRLAPGDRVALAERLWASVGAPELAGINQAWAEEIEKRVDEVESGGVSAVPAEEVLARIEGKLRTRGK